MTMAATERLFVLTFAIDGDATNPIEAIVNHVGVRRYLDAGYAIKATGTVVKGKTARVPLIVPEDEGCQR